MLVVRCALQYWDDAADAMRPGEGTLLPLWKFTHRRAKRKQVGFVALRLLPSPLRCCSAASLARPAAQSLLQRAVCRSREACRVDARCESRTAAAPQHGGLRMSSLRSANASF